MPSNNEAKEKYKIENQRRNQLRKIARLDKFTKNSEDKKKEKWLSSMWGRSLLLLW